jgi:Domain of unknown function (DUF4157)
MPERVPATSAAPQREPGAPARLQRAYQAPAAGGHDTSPGVPRRAEGDPGLSRLMDRLGRAYAADFSSVQVHTESSRVPSEALAVTQGDDIHISRGHFAPGTRGGDILIAHELAHVLQQRRGGAIVARDVTEADADIAASAAVRGGRARVLLGAPAGPQHYEAWEHRELGDAFGGSERKVTLPNGITLTYGQIIALSGDFYRSPEALLRSSATEMQKILDIMERESRQAQPHAAPDGGISYAPSGEQVNQNNADYELATTGHTRLLGSDDPLLGEADQPGGPHGTVSGGEHIESDAPSAEAGFISLATSNPSHFSSSNIRQNWIAKHQLALDLARQAWLAGPPGSTPAPLDTGDAVTASGGGPAPSVRGGQRSAAQASAGPPLDPTTTAAAPGRPDPAAVPTKAGTTAVISPDADGGLKAEAWVAAGFSDHYLTDAFAAGHLVSGDRSIYQGFYTNHKAAIIDACIRCASADQAPLAVQGFIAAIGPFLDKLAGNLLLKVVHDYYNGQGVRVRNALGQEWTTFGDAHLGGHRETIAMASLASKASRDAVEDVLTTGRTKRAYAALDYIPDIARIGNGEWESIETFAKDSRVWNPVLAPALSPDPAANPLYKLAKGNIGPVVSVGARQAGRAIVKGAKAAGRAVVNIPEDFQRWLESLDRGLREGATSDPFNDLR